MCYSQIHRYATACAYNLCCRQPPQASPLPDFPLAAAANSHKCHVRQFVICVKDAAANASVAALESWNKDAQMEQFL